MGNLCWWCDQGLRFPSGCQCGKLGTFPDAVPDGLLSGDFSLLWAAVQEAWEWGQAGSKRNWHFNSVGSEWRHPLCLDRGSSAQTANWDESIITDNSNSANALFWLWSEQQHCEVNLYICIYNYSHIPKMKLKLEGCNLPKGWRPVLFCFVFFKF